MRHNKAMTLDELRRSKRDEILWIATKHGARNVRVFGSLARGEHSPSSDVDILVDMDPDRSLMDLGGLLMDLQAMLETRVDVATEKMLRPKIREWAMRDAVPL
jgi:predicted nucleotidyltransferase